MAIIDACCGTNQMLIRNKMSSCKAETKIFSLIFTSERENELDSDIKSNPKTVRA